MGHQIVSSLVKSKSRGILFPKSYVELILPIEPGLRGGRDWTGSRGEGDGPGGTPLPERRLIPSVSFERSLAYHVTGWCPAAGLTANSYWNCHYPPVISRRDPS